MKTKLLKKLRREFEWYYRNAFDDSFMIHIKCKKTGNCSFNWEGVNKSNVEDFIDVTKYIVKSRRRRNFYDKVREKSRLRHQQNIRNNYYNKWKSK